jgi:outer membrane protein assembly factor BamA
VVNFYGLGNASVDVTADNYHVDQRQWLFNPALEFSVSDRSDISLGPVLQYTTTNPVPGSYLSGTQPYGTGNFGQVGMRLGLFLDKRDQAKDPRKGILLDLSGTWFPGVWDVETAFGALAGSAAAYFTLPVPLRPVLVLRAGGKKVYGSFPYFESAFLGGRGSVRRLDLQRYAGDASLVGTTELQIPLLKFPLVFPVDLGIYGFADAGRVYVAGDSPGGWHRNAGVGLWFGILNPSTALNLELGDRRGRSLLRIRTGLNF